MGKNKQPKSGSLPPAGKVPRTDPAAEAAIREAVPVWSFRCVDGDGTWSWGLVDPDHLVDALKRLASYETMKWGEIERAPSCGFIDVTELCKDAQDRLVKINQKDAEMLFKLRITGGRRVWGLRRGVKFEILWWDPQHSVYPMNIANN